MRRIARLLTVVFLFGILVGCGVSEPTMAEHVFFAMDTIVTLRLSYEKSDGTRRSTEKMEQLFMQAEAQVGEIERALSRTVADSDTARLNADEAGLSSPGAQFVDVLSRALEIAEQTDGAFSPTLGMLTTLWNVNGGGPVPTDASRLYAMAHTDYHTLTIEADRVTKSDSRVQVDLGGIAKGYAVESLCAWLEEQGIARGIVSLGGNVGVFGEKTDGSLYKIGITDPRDSDAVMGYVYIAGGTVSVSGDYERYFEEDGVRYHHILDPETGCPADSGLSSVAVLSSDGALADALSTALFVMGTSEALAYYEAHPGTFEAVLITTDKEIVLTRGLRYNEDFIPSGGGYTLSSITEELS